MKRRLLLTGPIGCGKSTAIARALGDRLTSAGGFLTRRYRQPHLHFTLESPDGKQKEVFLDFSDGQPHLNLGAFDRLGTGLPKADFLILDEIGGVELLCPEFQTVLDDLLESNIPIIGVLKGEGPAGTLIQTLGLTRKYEEAANHLRTRLLADANTLIYECSQFDEQANILAENWVKEYAHG